MKLKTIQTLPSTAETNAIPHITLFLKPNLTPKNPLDGDTGIAVELLMTNAPIRTTTITDIVIIVPEPTNPLLLAKDLSVPQAPTQP